jgi:long-subunit acyl-CoA synthetase (AMP-forming)
MNALDALAVRCAQAPDALILHEPERSWTGAALQQRIADWQQRLAAIELPGQDRLRLVSLLDNGVDAVALDLAARRLGAVHVPLPAFFHPRQIEHVLSSVGADALIRTDPSAVTGWSMQSFQPTQRQALPAGTDLITFTSGTTGTPKGVCLPWTQLDRVAASLVQASGTRAPHRHLCLLPLGVLLEQVGGIYAPIQAGAEIVLLPLAQTGLQGAAAVDGTVLAHNLRQWQAHSAILLPQMLDALVEAVLTGHNPGPQLRFLAVGGGRVAAASIERARDLGLPVYQGYGLSEAGSVVCLERPAAAHAGSVGQPLAHQSLQIDDNGQIWLDEPGFVGYLGDPLAPPRPWPTGDLGVRTATGEIELRGRLGHRLITSFGRNVSPEWVESELTAHPALAQAFVHGDGCPYLSAVVVPAHTDLSEAELSAAIATVNLDLPDYARIRTHRRAAPFRVEDGLLTANGRLQRAALLARYESDPSTTASTATSLEHA